MKTYIRSNLSELRGLVALMAIVALAITFRAIERRAVDKLGDRSNLSVATTTELPQDDRPEDAADSRELQFVTAENKLPLETTSATVQVVKEFPK